MDFTLTEAHEEFRQQIRALIAEYVTDEVVNQAHETGTNHAIEFHRALGRAGLLERAMPGEGKDPVDLWLLSSETEKLGVPADATGMALAIAAVVNTVGTDDQKQRVAKRLSSGEDLVCFGLTEPDGGSDLPAIKTRATPDGDGGWIINGAKMWTTMAHIADWVFLLTRTDAEGDRYAGFTVFIVPMDTPGITVDPVWTMSTERSNATFYDDVRVGPEAVLVGPGEGWSVLGHMLGYERGMGNTGFLGPLLRRFAAWASDSGAIGDPTVRQHMAQVAIDHQISELLTQRTVWTATTGRPPGTEGSIAKVFATEAYQHHARWAQETAAPASLLGLHQPGAAAHGWVDHDVRHSTPQTLQGGTSEINRNNIAERYLGLPRFR